MAPSVVQAATGASSATTVAVVLGAAPTPGNLLIALHQAAANVAVTTLAGWTRRSSAVSKGLHVHTRIADATDGTTTTWAHSPAANLDLTILEVAGQTTDIPSGLTDAVALAAGLTHTVPVSSPPNHSLLVIALRSGTAASGFSAAEAGWTTHNQGGAGGAISLAGVYSRGYAGPPDTNTDLSLTSTVSATVTYSSFSVPGTAPPPSTARQGKLPPQVS